LTFGYCTETKAALPFSIGIPFLVDTGMEDMDRDSHLEVQVTVVVGEE